MRQITVFRKSFIFIGLLIWLSVPVGAVTDSLTITITIAPGVGIANEQIPTEYGVSKPYPNPFNPSTQFTLAIPEVSQVLVQIYDLRGRRIAELAAGEYSAGYHDIIWRANGVASGIYLVRVQSRFGTTITKVLLLK